MTNRVSWHDHFHVSLAWQADRHNDNAKIRYFTLISVCRRYDAFRTGNLVHAAMTGILLVGASPVFAQEPGRDTQVTNHQESADRTGRVFGRLDFEQFAPSTALDILVQIPAFVIEESDGNRGLGRATSNVLLNGERIVSKSVGVRRQLQQIPATRVIEVVILEGAATKIPGLTGQVADVRIRSAPFTARYSWSPGIDVGGFFVPSEGNVSVAGTLGRLDYSAGLSNDTSLRRMFQGKSRLSLTDGTVLQDRAIEFRTRYDEPEATAALTWRAPGGYVATIRGSYQAESSDVLAVERELIGESEIQAITGGSDNIFKAWEIGGDITLPFAAGDLKFNGLFRNDIADLDQFQILQRLIGTQTGSRFVADSIEQETITRAEYSWTSGPSTFQISGEAAFNDLNTDAELFVLNNEGVFVQEPFPSASGDVSESRYEAAVSYARPLLQNLTLQLTVGGEYSKLSTMGVRGSSREFYRPKGIISFAWNPKDDFAVSLSAERKIGQLSFSDFLAQVFIDEERLNVGNSDLLPPQSTEIELEVSKEFGAYGNMALTVFDRQISDLVDVVSVNGGESPGNLSAAYRRGFNLNGTLQLEPLGVPGARFDADISYEDSNVEDPSSGLDREISFTREWFAALDFRHDIPASEIAYGLQFFYGTDRPYFRIFEAGTSRDTQYLTSLFLEYKDVLGLKLVARANNIFGNEQSQFRRFFGDGRDSGNPAIAEMDSTRRETYFDLTLEGQF